MINPPFMKIHANGDVTDSVGLMPAMSTDWIFSTRTCDALWELSRLMRRTGRRFLPRMLTDWEACASLLNSHAWKRRVFVERAEKSHLESSTEKIAWLGFAV